MAETLTNSRFITYPSLVDKSTSCTLVLVKPTEEDVTNVETFCRVCNRNYDIYLFNNEDGDWFESVTSRCDYVVDSANPVEFLQNIDDQA